MGVFHVFKIVQKVPNLPTYHTYKQDVHFMKPSNHVNGLIHAELRRAKVQEEDDTIEKEKLSKY